MTSRNIDDECMHEIILEGFCVFCDWEEPE